MSNNTLIERAATKDAKNWEEGQAIQGNDEDKDGDTEVEDRREHTKRGR
jgi:hypothetical protein